MIITPAQLQKLSDAQEIRFIHETVQRLRETEPRWAEGRSDGELCVRIEDSVRFAESCRIRRRDAVTAVIEAFVHYAPASPIDNRLMDIIRQPNVPEAVRAEQFYISLASGRYLLQEIALVS